MKGFGGAFVVIVFVKQIAAEGWSYENLDEWPETCQTGTEQSPINLGKASATKTNFSQIEFYNYYNASAVIQNTGHTVEIRISEVGEASSLAHVTGGAFGLNDYTMDNLHFHWDSEHTIDGYSYPLEAHFVHYSSELENVTNGMNYRHGLAVLAVMYEIDESCGISSFEDIIDKIDDISTNVTTTIELTNIINFSDLLPTDTSNFFLYNGSLTTPDCNEGVLWVVFEEPACITSTQLTKLKSIYTTENRLLESNNRPLQDLNGREILYRSASVRSKGSNLLYYVLCTITIFKIIRIS